MKKNEQPQVQSPPITFAKIQVFTEDGVEVFEYAQHSIQFNPSGGGLLIVQATKGEMETAIYVIGSFKKVVLTPTKLSLA